MSPAINETWDSDAFIMFFSKFTATEAGKYIISTTVSAKNMDAGKFWANLVRVNNSTKRQWSGISHGLANTWVTVVTSYELAVDDYVEIFMLHDNPTVITLTGLIQVFNVSIMKVA